MLTISPISLVMEVLACSPLSDLGDLKTDSVAGCLGYRDVGTDHPGDRGEGPSLSVEPPVVGHNGCKNQ